MEQSQHTENHAVIDLLYQVKQMTTKIPLLDAIKEVPNYNKSIKEAYIKQIGRKKKDPKIIHVLGHLSYLLLKKLTISKYSNFGSPLVTITIHGIQVQNALVYLEASIKVMKKEVLSQLHIISLRETHTILQLTNSCIIKLDGMIEYVRVTLNSWEYPIDFIILSPKANMGG